jgi:hypothetical protein
LASQPQTAEVEAHVIGSSLRGHEYRFHGFVLRLVRHEDRDGHAGEQRPAGSTQHHLAHPGMAVDAHHDKVGIVIGGTRQDHPADIGIRRHILLERDLDAMAREPGGRVGTRFGTVAFGRSCGIDDKDDDLLRRLEKRQSVSMTLISRRWPGCWSRRLS